MFSGPAAPVAGPIKIAAMATIPTLEEIRQAFREELASFQPPAPARQSTLLPIGRAAEMFSVSENTIVDWSRRGGPKISQPVPRGNRFVDVGELEAWIRKGGA